MAASFRWKARDGVYRLIVNYSDADWHCSIEYSIAWSKTTDFRYFLKFIYDVSYALFIFDFDEFHDIEDDYVELEKTDAWNESEIFL